MFGIDPIVELGLLGRDDEVLARLLTFPNVIVTAHQAFLTREALHEISTTTLANATAFDAGEPLRHELTKIG